MPGLYPATQTVKDQCRNRSFSSKVTSGTGKELGGSYTLCPFARCMVLVDAFPERRPAFLGEANHQGLSPRHCCIARERDCAYGYRGN